MPTSSEVFKLRSFKDMAVAITNALRPYFEADTMDEVEGESPVERRERPLIQPAIDALRRDATYLEESCKTFLADGNPSDRT